MGNRYDIPAQQPDVHSYIPLPIDQIAKGADAQQQQWDNTQTKLGAFGKVLAGNTGLTDVYGTSVPDNDLVQKRNQYYNDRVSGAVDKFHKDLSAPGLNNELSSIAEDYAKDASPSGIYGKAADRVKMYQTQREAERGNKDLVDDPHLNWENKKNWLKYGQLGGLGNKDATDMDLNQLPFGAKIDLTKKVDEAVNGINKLSSYTDAKGTQHSLVGASPVVGANGVHYIQTRDGSRIESGKILGTLNPILGDNEHEGTDSEINGYLNSKAKYLEETGQLKGHSRSEYINTVKNELRSHAVNKYLQSDDKVGLTENSGWYAGLKENREAAKEKENAIIFSGESTATSGMTQSYKDIASSLTGNKTKILQLQAQPNTVDTRAQIKDLQKTIDVQNSTLNHAKDVYVSSSEGKDYLKDIWNRANDVSGNINNKDNQGLHFSNSIFGKDSDKNGDYRPRVDGENGKQQLTYGEFEEAVKGKYDISHRFKDPKIQAWYNNAVETTKQEASNRGVKKLNETPESYTSNILSGTDFDKRINDPLTNQVTESAQNYILPNGQQLDPFMKDNLSKGYKVHVQALDKDVNDHYAHQLTIKDEKGNTVGTTPIYPKNAEDEKDKIGQELMRKSTGDDMLDQRNYGTGLRMRADAHFPQINEELEKDFTNSGGYGESRKFDIPLGDGRVLKDSYIKKEQAKDGDKVQDRYKLYQNGQVVYFKDSKGNRHDYEALSKEDLKKQLYTTLH